MENTVKNKLMLDKDICVYLKGIAILFVICGHILGGMFGILDTKTTAIMGTGGVNIFLILSGYGLFSSFQKKGICAKEYWSKKINKIFIPYGIVTCLYFVFLRLRGSSVNVYTLVLNILCIDFSRHMDGTMWYMSFLLLWYALFFVVFYFDYPQVFKVIMIFACGYLFQSGIMVPIFDECSWQFEVNAYAFPFGVLIGYVFGVVNQFVPEEKLLSIKKWFGPVLACVCAGMMLCGFLGVLTLSYLQWGVCYLVFFYRVLRILSNKLAILHWFGANSFFLYLIEGKMMSVVNVVDIAKENLLLYLVVYAALIYLSVWVYNYLYPRLMSALQKCNV